MAHKKSQTKNTINTSQSDSIKDIDVEVVSIDEEHNHGVQTEYEDEEVVLEPLEKSPYEVSYTCLLLPRFASHQLTGDIANKLRVILKQISISYGWHLEFLSVKAEYLHWVIRVPPSTSTTFVIQVVRAQTTDQIFEDFPHFKNGNQPVDFWAPGYLIFWGSQPHPVEIIQRYIRQTRKLQGVLMDE